jgi:carboxyl-terminal processing protease
LLLVLASLVALTACSSIPPGTIGALLGKREDGRLFIRGIPPGEGADRAGLAIDDEIIAINGKEVRAMTPSDVKEAVRGDVGTTLVLTIERDGQRRDVKVERSPILPGPRAAKTR